MNQTSLARTDTADERALVGELPPSESATRAVLESVSPVPAPLPARQTTSEVPVAEAAAEAGALQGATSANMFASFMAAGSAPRFGRVRQLTVLLSVSAHAALLAVGAVASFWEVEELSAPRVAVTFLSLPSAPPPPPPAARKSAERPRARPMRPLRQPVVAVQQQPPPPEDAEERDKDEAGSAGGMAGGVTGGVVGALSATPPPRAPLLSPQERQALIRKYLEQVVGPRIRSRLRMPPEAERLGIEGGVLLQASIDGSGRLLALRPVGACAFEVLCEDAARTIREAAPFPPPPPALVEGVVVDVPLNYKLQ